MVLSFVSAVDLAPLTKQQWLVPPFSMAEGPTSSGMTLTTPASKPEEGFYAHRLARGMQSAHVKQDSRFLAQAGSRLAGEMIRVPTRPPPQP